MSEKNANANSQAGAGKRVVALAARLTESALDVTWRQWSALDAQAAVNQPARSIVDPEALILLSLSLIDEEKRFADLLRDWIVRNSDLISIQRVRNLSRAYQEPVARRLGWLAEVAITEAKDPRWRSIPRPANPSAMSHGKMVRAGKDRARRARFSTAASLLARLRSGLGVGAKTDTLAFLLGNDGRWATVREITLATGYTIAAVRRAAEDMAAARLIRSRNDAAAEYGADQVAWGRLLGLGPTLPRWRDWAQRFEFVAAFRQWAAALRLETSPYASDVAVRELVSKHSHAFRDQSPLENRYQQGPERTAASWEAVESLSRRMLEEA